MSKASKYVDHMYSLYEGRAAVTVGINSESRTVHPFVFENHNKIPIGLIAMCASNSITPNEVDLYHISAFITGRGRGSEMLRFLCQTADEFGVRLCIEATVLVNGNDAMSNATLTRWYRKYGFHGNGSMFREPVERCF